MIDMAVRHKQQVKKQGRNYFDRKTVHIKQWRGVYSEELCDRDPALSGAAIIAKCHSYYDRAEKTMMDFRARSCMKDPAIQFPTYFAAIAN